MDNFSWDDFLNIIKSKLSSVSYDTWFKNTKLVSLDNNVFETISPFNFKILYASLLQPLYPACSTTYFPCSNVLSSIYFTVYGIYDSTFDCMTTSYSVSSLIP